MSFLAYARTVVVMNEWAIRTVSNSRDLGPGIEGESQVCHGVDKV